MHAQHKLSFLKKYTQIIFWTASILIGCLLGYLALHLVLGTTARRKTEAIELAIHKAGSKTYYLYSKNRKITLKLSGNGRFEYKEEALVYKRTLEVRGTWGLDRTNHEIKLQSDETTCITETASGNCYKRAIFSYCLPENRLNCENILEFEDENSLRLNFQNLKVMDAHSKSIRN